MIDLYEFEFVLLPYLIELCSEMKLQPMALTDKGFIRETVENNYGKVPWDWDDFKIKVYDIGGNPVIIYQFPEPDMPPLARFAATIAENNRLNYYTIEYENFLNKVTWYFNRKHKQGHENLGEVNECVTMEDFANLIASKFLATRPLQDS